jgi:SAM-dependent methyltransferase
MGSQPVSFLDIQIHTGWSRVLQSFADWCQPQADWITLDVGCGPGLLPCLLSQRGCTAFGIDLEAKMFSPPRLHLQLAQADSIHLPFPTGAFDLVTASNLLFLIIDPRSALREMRRLIRQEGQIDVLNPSESMSVIAATTLADQRGLQGLERDSLLNWAAIAEANRRWGVRELQELFNSAGLELVDTVLKVGPGLARFAKGVRL